MNYIKRKNLIYLLDIRIKFYLFDQEEVGDKSKETAPESKLQQVCFNRLAN